MPDVCYGIHECVCVNRFKDKQILIRFIVEWKLMYVVFYIMEFGASRVVFENINKEIRGFKGGI